MITRLSYAQLLETNWALQHVGDITYWQCVTRTTQESKLFPVPAYMMLSYANCFYRYPSLLRKIESRMSAEELGDRARQLGTKVNTLTMGWAMPGFYLLGREWLINLGLIRPEDAVEDVAYVMDFWKRVSLAYHRSDYHLTNKDYTYRSNLLSEPVLQVLDADLYDCEPGDPLHTAAAQFTATISQYVFLSHCECRIGTCNDGPYNFGEKRELLVRHFLDLAEGDYPWLDGVAKDVPYNNLTVPVVLKDTHFTLVDDWGSFESEPEFKQENVCRVGLYTSDPLSEGFIPVGMESRETLIKTFESLRDTFREATARLWKRIAGWSRDQMLDAGALVYYNVPKDLAHFAGVYEQADWMEIDVRAERLRPLLNDEYGRDVLTELVGLISLPSQQFNEYGMTAFSNKPSRTHSPIPYSILRTGDYTTTVGPLYPGITNLPKKEGAWRTTWGELTLAEFNKLASDFRPAYHKDDLRYLDEVFVKYNAGSPEADALYRAHQASSRTLEGKGAGLRRADIASTRR